MYQVLNFLAADSIVDAQDTAKDKTKVCVPIKFIFLWVER